MLCLPCSRWSWERRASWSWWWRYNVSRQIVEDLATDADDACPLSRSRHCSKLLTRVSTALRRWLQPYDWRRSTWNTLIQFVDRNRFPVERTQRMSQYGTNDRSSLHCMLLLLLLMTMRDITKILFLVQLETLTNSIGFCLFNCLQFRCNVVYKLDYWRQC